MDARGRARWRRRRCRDRHCRSTPAPLPAGAGRAFLRQRLGLRLPEGKRRGEDTNRSARRTRPRAPRAAARGVRRVARGARCATRCTHALRARGLLPSGAAGPARAGRACWTRCGRSRRRFAQWRGDAQPQIAAARSRDRRPAPARPLADVWPHGLARAAPRRTPTAPSAIRHGLDWLLASAAGVHAAAGRIPRRRATRGIGAASRAPALDARRRRATRCAACWRCALRACASRCRSRRTAAGAIQRRRARARRCEGRRATVARQRPQLGRGRRRRAAAGAARPRSVRRRATRGVRRHRVRPSTGALIRAVCRRAERAACIAARRSTPRTPNERAPCPARDPYLDLPLDGVRLIEASAGTGKTFTLATLFTRLVVERGLRVGQVLAVTFTEAATQELRKRIRERLQLALRSWSTHRARPTTTSAEVALHARRSCDAHRARGGEDRRRAAPPPAAGRARNRPRRDLHHPRLLRARAARTRAGERARRFDAPELLANDRACARRSRPTCGARTAATRPAPTTCAALWRDGPTALAGDLCAAAARAAAAAAGRAVAAAIRRPRCTRPAQALRDALRAHGDDVRAALRGRRRAQGAQRQQLQGRAGSTRCGRSWRAWCDAGDCRRAARRRKLAAAAPRTPAGQDQQGAARAARRTRRCATRLPRYSTRCGARTNGWPRAASRCCTACATTRARAWPRSSASAACRPRRPDRRRRRRARRPARRRAGAQRCARSTRSRWSTSSRTPTRASGRSSTRVFGAQASGAPALFLVGDPKQAIYRFRGGDVHTYLRRARTAPTRAAAGPQLPFAAVACSRAVDALFDAARGERRRSSSDGIDFATSHAGGRRGRRDFLRDGAPAPALTLCAHCPPPDGKRQDQACKAERLARARHPRLRRRDPRPAAATRATAARCAAMATARRCSRATSRCWCARHNEATRMRRRWRRSACPRSPPAAEPVRHRRGARPAGAAAGAAAARRRPPPARGAGDACCSASMPPRSHALDDDGDAHRALAAATRWPGACAGSARPAGAARRPVRASTPRACSACSTASAA